MGRLLGGWRGWSAARWKVVVLCEVGHRRIRSIDVIVKPHLRQIGVVVAWGSGHLRVVELPQCCVWTRGDAALTPWSACHVIAL